MRWSGLSSAYNREVAVRAAFRDRGWGWGGEDGVSICDSHCVVSSLRVRVHLRWARLRVRAEVYSHPSDWSHSHTSYCTNMPLPPLA